MEDGDMEKTPLFDENLLCQREYAAAIDSNLLLLIRIPIPSIVSLE